MSSAEDRSGNGSDSWFRDAKYSPIWIAIGATGAIVTAALTATLVVLSIRAYLEGVTSSLFDIVEAAIFALLLAMSLTILREVVRRGSSRKPPPLPPVMPWYVAEALPFVDRIKEIWSPQSNHITAFTFVSRGIQSVSVNPSAGGGTVTDDERAARVQIGDMLNAWTTVGLTTTNSISIARYMLSNFAPGDEVSFSLGIEMLDIVVGDGVRFANSFCQAARRAGVVRVAPYLKDQWETFRDKANRLSDDFTTFHRKVSELRGGTVIPYVEVIPGL